MTSLLAAEPDQMKPMSSLSTLWSKYIPYIHIGVILLLGFVSYANSFAVPEQLDDQAVLRTYNQVGSDLYSFEYLFRRARWFTDVTFSLNHLLHGERVFGFHLVNLAIHISSAVVLYLMLQRIIEALKRTFRVSECDAFLPRFIPFATAALFVCHPVQTQAVTYITQRHTSLATFLYLGSMLSYLLARLSFADETKKLHVWSWSFACIFLALLAMKSKEIAITLPLMIVAFEIALFRGHLLKNRLFLFLAAGLLLVIPLQTIYPLVMRRSGNLLHHLYIATSETPSISRIDYLLTQFRVVATYLRLLILPINQNMDYDYPVYHSLFNPAVFAALLLHITLAGLALALFIRSRRHLTSGTPSAGIYMRLVSLGIFWFYLSMSVESSLMPIRDVIFEHRIYLPSVGFFMAAAGLFGFAAYRWRYRNISWAAIVLLCIVFTATTIARNRIWASEFVMWQDVLKKSPNKGRVRFNIGFQYFKKYKLEQALPHFVRALELDTSMKDYWDTFNSAMSLFVCYEGRCSSGFEYFDLVDKVNIVKPENKHRWVANNYNSLGLAYEHLGNLYLARENYLKSVKANPFFDLAWFNLALVSARKNDAAAVESSLNSLRTINPALEQHAAKIIREQPH